MTDIAVAAAPILSPAVAAPAITPGAALTPQIAGEAVADPFAALLASLAPSPDAAAAPAAPTPNPAALAMPIVLPAIATKIALPAPPADEQTPLAEHDGDQSGEQADDDTTDADQDGNPQLAMMLAIATPAVAIQPAALVQTQAISAAIAPPIPATNLAPVALLAQAPIDARPLTPKISDTTAANRPAADASVTEDTDAPAVDSAPATPIPTSVLPLPYTSRFAQLAVRLMNSAAPARADTLILAVSAPSRASATSAAPAASTMSVTPAAPRPVPASAGPVTPVLTQPISVASAVPVPSAVPLPSATSAEPAAPIVMQPPSAASAVPVISAVPPSAISAEPAATVVMQPPSAASAVPVTSAMPLPSAMAAEPAATVVTQPPSAASATSAALVAQAVSVTSAAPPPLAVSAGPVAPVATQPPPAASARSAALVPPPAVSVTSASPTPLAVSAGAAATVVTQPLSKAPKTTAAVLPMATRGDSLRTAEAAPKPLRDETLAPAAASAPAPVESAKNLLNTPDPTATLLVTPSAHSTAPAPTSGVVPTPMADTAVHRELSVARDGQWLDMLARDIAATAGKDGQMSFRLDPQHLGRLTVHIRHSEGGASIRLSADTEAARQMLTEAQPRLAAEARAQGLTLRETSVDLGGSGGGQSGQQGAGSTFASLAQGQSQREPGRDQTFINLDGREADDPAHTSPTSARSDLYA